MKPEIRFTRFFSTDSAKAIKADKFGYLNGINYMAQDDTASTAEKYFTLCPHSTAGCRALCLGKYSGQAAMVTDLEHGTNAVRESRVRKARYFMNERPAFMAEMNWHIHDLARKARRKNKKLAIRPNGSTDVRFERIKHNGQTVMELHPTTQFIDYTKNLKRLLDKTRPANYHLTFSLSEENKAKALQALAAGFNVAVVFGNGQPKRYLGHDVIDGTVHDLRHLDPAPCIVGLDPKGAKAKADQSGFVVRNY
jgi:hypothetical protein